MCPLAVQAGGGVGNVNAAPSVEKQMTGRILAQKYEIVRLIGQGGMGAVYEARNHLGKRYAVKMLLTAEFASDPQLAARFFREAKASASIESEHIVEVYDTGVDNETNCPFIIMELLRGEDLEHTIARVGALSPLAASRVIGQAAVGLAKAHEAGIIHRDIKPANIFMTSRDGGDSIVKILDFGIAKHQEMLASTDAGLTKTGSMLGTPLYMSPEQAQGAKTIDPRSDVWSLSMCLYESLSGRTPWGDVDTLGGLILAICSRDVPMLQDIAPWVPGELAQVVHRGLTRDIAQRIPSASALVDLLRPFAGGTLTISPDILIGVEEAQRRTVAPRVDVALGSSTGAMTSSQTMARSEGKKSSTGLYVGIGLVAVLAIGGAVFAVTHMGKDSDKTAAAPPPASAKSIEPAAASPATAATPAPAPADFTADLSIKMPAGSIVKIGKENVTAKVKDGKLSLTGKSGDLYIVTVYKDGENLVTQKVYMGDGYLVPDELDTQKGEVAVKPPPPAPTTKPTGIATGVATKPPPAVTKSTGAAPPPATTVKPPSTVATTFE